MKIKITSFILAICILFESCGASNHLGKTFVQKPDASATDQQKWFAYYQDQFDAYGGQAVPPQGAILESEGYTPPAGTYNQAAIDGYQQAQMDWSVKVKKASRGTMWSLCLGVTAFCLALPLIMISSMRHVQ